MQPVKIGTWSEVPDREPVGATIEGIDLVIVRRGSEPSVLYGRCLHRGALLCDGSVQDDNLLCGLHGWDYRIDTRVSAYNNAEVLEKFSSFVEGDDVMVDRDEVLDFKMRHPQPYDPDVYQGYYTDPHLVPEEPFVDSIQELATNGLSKTGMHGPMAAMGVSREELPTWDDIQFVTAQLARLPLLDDEPVGTEVCIGPNAEKPLWLDMPLFVSDMSFGALSFEAKTALARGAELAGTGICSGEGGCSPRSRRRAAATSTSSPPPVSAGTPRCWRRCRPFTSSSVRARRPGPVGTFPATRSSGGLPRSVVSRRERRRYRRRAFPTGNPSTTSRASLTMSAKNRVASQSA